MALLRVRVTSFLVGFGVAAGLALYQLRQDVVQSHSEIKDAVRVTFIARRVKVLSAILFHPCCNPACNADIRTLHAVCHAP